MAIWFAQHNNLETNTQSLRTNIGYYLRALDCCTIEFPYYRDLKTGLAENYAQLAHEYYRAEELKTALNFYEKAIEHNHHHFQARNQVGCIYLKQKKHDAAIKCFEEIVSLANEPYDIEHKADALLSLALIYYNSEIKGGIDRAYKYVINADSIYPNYSLTSKIMKDIMSHEKSNDNISQMLSTNFLDKKSVCNTQEEESEIFTPTL